MQAQTLIASAVLLALFGGAFVLLSRLPMPPRIRWPLVAWLCGLTVAGGLGFLVASDIIANGPVVGLAMLGGLMIWIGSPVFLILGILRMQGQRDGIAASHADSPGLAAQQANPMTGATAAASTTPEERTCLLQVTASHTSVDFLYEAFRPTIEINGARYTYPWGTHDFPMMPGRHTVSVSYPWLVPECGKSTVSVDLAPGERKRVAYHAGMARFVPGKMLTEPLPRIPV